jgi:hypothetical protein
MRHIGVRIGSSSKDFSPITTTALYMLIQQATNRSSVVNNNNFRANNNNFKSNKAETIFRFRHIPILQALTSELTNEQPIEATTIRLDRY